MRPPDLTIGDPPQMYRWHLLRWRGVQVALHKWVRSDADRALHDHTATNISILLTGTYLEQFSHAWEAPRAKLRLPLIPYFRRGETPHRVVLHRGPVWTIWIRLKPHREWGFHCAKGWRHWREYIDGDYRVSGTMSGIGKGCE
jgi:hypothetical protein